MNANETDTDGYRFNARRLLDDYPAWAVKGTPSGYEARRKAHGRGGQVKAASLDELARLMAEADAEGTTASGRLGELVREAEALGDIHRLALALQNVLTLTAETYQAFGGEKVREAIETGLAG
jgi:hypothetical protein